MSIKSRLNGVRTVRGNVGLLGTVTVFLIALGTGVLCPALENPKQIEYSMAVRNASTHLFDIVMTVRGFSAPYIDVALPAWLPGYNKIQNFARNLQEFEARDDRGIVLRAEKLDKQTWRVFCEGNSTLRISYRIYTNSLSNLNVCAHEE